MDRLRVGRPPVTWSADANGDRLLAFGGESWPIGRSLADRDGLTYRMLPGRNALRGRVVVGPDISFSLADFAG